MINVKVEDRIAYEGKQCKITKEQKRALVDFVTSNFTYRRGLFKLRDETQNKDELWEQVSDHLNSIGSRKTTTGWRKTCADLRMHLKKKLMEGKELSAEDAELAEFYGMNLNGNELSIMCYERLSSEQKARMIDLVCDNYTFNTLTAKLEPVSEDSLSWDEIATDLNSMGTCAKTTSGWKKCWSDIKCDVAKKFDGPAVPLRLTPGEFKIAELYNFNNFTYQMAEVKEMEVELGDDDAVDEEHLDTIYVEDDGKGEHNAYAEEIEDIDLIDQEEAIHNDSIKLQSSDSELPDRKQQIYQIQEFEPVTTNESRTVNVMERLLEEQKRTNDLLEKLLEQQKASTVAQLEMLNELRNNSFFVMSNPNRNNNVLS